MARRRMIALSLLAVLGLLVVSVVVAVKLLLNEERLAAFARERVQASLGREFKLDELSLQFRPLPTVRLKHVSLGNAPWAKQPYLVYAEQATARLDLTSLLRGKLEIASLSIEGLKANLEISQDGRKNWQMQNGSAAKNSGNKPVAPLHLAAIQIKDAQVHYVRDGEAAKNWHLEEFDVRAETGLRDVRLDAKLLQHDIPLMAKARFADLSRLGQEDAVTQGEMEFSAGSGRLLMSGLLPISGALRKHKIKLDFDAHSPKEVLGFFGISDVRLAPIKASADLQETGNGIQVDNLLFQIGHLKVNGKGQIKLAGDKPHYQASLATEYLDWAQALDDFGRPPLSPKPPDQLFRDTPLGWRAISALQKVKGKTELHIQRVKLRSGIELKNLKASIDAADKQFGIEKFSFGMLDGVVDGALILNGNRKSAKLGLDMHKVSLGKWLAARGSKIALTGGPMELRASLSARGLSMKDLSESLTGPVRISVGPAKLQSKQVQQAESWLIGLAPVFSANQTDYVNLACVSAYLPFQNGRAAAEPIGGIRSDASQLLASGYLDFKKQGIDLRGRVRARSGVSLGVANIASGNVKIAGRIDKPSVGLDPDSTPGALARIGAAIITSGVSILATALWDAANPASDPCQITFSAHEKRPRSKVTTNAASTDHIHAN